MQSQKAAQFVALASVFILASCGAPNNPAFPSVPSATSAATNHVPHGGFGDIQLALPVIVPANPPPVPGASPTGLSSATRSVSGTFGKNEIPAFTLTSSARGCAAESDGLHCTLTARVPAGTGVLEFHTFASRDGSGKPLAQSVSEFVIVYAGQTNVVTPPQWIGDAVALKLATTPSFLTQGSPGRANACLYGIDAAGAIIPMTSLNGPDGKRVVWTGEATGTYSQPLLFDNASRAGPGQPFKNATFVYDGRLAGTETIEAENGKTIYASAKLRLKPGVTGNAQLFVWNASTSDQSSTVPATLVQFAADATGDAKPLRSFYLDAPAIAAGTSGGFWSGPFGGSYAPSWVELYDSTGSGVAQLFTNPTSSQFAGAAVDTRGRTYGVQGNIYLGTGPCELRDPTLTIYGPVSGGGRVERQITLAQSLDCAVNVAVDSKANAFISDPGNDFTIQPFIMEFGPNVSGDAAPLRSIYLDSYSTSGPIATDGAGNLFAIVNGAVMEYAPGATTAEPVLPGLTVSAIAIDAQNDLYAAVRTTPFSGNSQAQYAIEEFAPGSTTPLRTIGGSDTGLTDPAAIVVAP